MSHPTLTNLVGQLFSDNLVEKAGCGKSMGGRKPDLYSLKEESFYLISIHIKKFKIKIAVVDNNNVIKRTKNAALQKEDTDVVDQIFELASDLIKALGIDQDKLLGIGICTPITGIISSEEGIGFTHFLTEQKPRSLQQILERKFCKPVHVFNDAQSIGLAEFYFGLAGNKKNVLVISMDWGLNLRIIIDGKLHNGSSGFAHVSVRPLEWDAFHLLY